MFWNLHIFVTFAEFATWENVRRKVSIWILRFGICVMGIKQKKHVKKHEILTFKLLLQEIRLKQENFLKL